MVHIQHIDLPGMVPYIPRSRQNGRALPPGFPEELKAEPLHLFFNIRVILLVPKGDDAGIHPVHTVQQPGDHPHILQHMNIL